MTLSVFPASIAVYLQLLGQFASTFFFTALNCIITFEHVSRSSCRTMREQIHLNRYKTQNILLRQYAILTKPVQVIEQIDTLLKDSQENKTNKQKRNKPDFKLTVNINYVNNRQQKLETFSTTGNHQPENCSRQF